MKKILYLGPIGLLVVGLSLFFITRSSEDEGIKTAVVGREEMVVSVEATGALESTDSIHISCPRVPDTWQFTVSFMAPEGRHIEEGQPLIRFDDKKLRDQLRVQQAELASAKKTLEKVKLEESETLEQLILTAAEKKVASSKLKIKMRIPEEHQKQNEVIKLKYDYDLAVAAEALAQTKVAVQREKQQSRIKAQENIIRLIENKVEQLNRSIESMTVKAPKSGLVVYKEDWRGNKVAVNDTVWFGKGLMELPDLKNMRVAAVIAERDAGRVASGQAVEIRLDASPDRVFAGEIESLGRIFRPKSRQKPSIVFDAAVRVEQPDPEIMRPGMSAKLAITIDRIENALCIPVDAVVYNGGETFVRVQGTLGKSKLKKVSLGRRSNGKVEVIEGLKEGVRVVVETSGEASDS